MESELRVSAPTRLTRPVLVAAFRGWNDGAQAASLAAGYLARLWGADQIADLDPEGFFDFQATRPHVSLVDGITRQIDWPETAFYHAKPPSLDRDVLLLLGIEPNLRWRTFTDLVVDHVQELGVELVVTLGALLADVPHTRPSPVTGSASDENLVKELGLSTSRYEGPTGIVGVLHDACNKTGIPSARLWAAVPHYVSLTPSPRAAGALCDRLGVLAPVDHRPTTFPSVEDRQQASQAVNGVAAHPRPRAVRPDAHERHVEAHRALAARFEHAVGRFAQDGDVAAQQLGPIAGDVPEAVVLAHDLLARVEHVRHVDRGLVDGRRQLELHGQTALHVGRAEAPQRVAVDAGAVIVVHRHRVGVAREHDAHGPAEIRTRDQIVLVPVHREPRRGPQLRLEVVGDRLLVMTERRDVDQLGRQVEQISHPTLTPSSRRISLRCVRSPG